LAKFRCFAVKKRYQIQLYKIISILKFLKHFAERKGGKETKVEKKRNMTINRSYITLVHVRVQLQAFYQNTLLKVRATPATFIVGYYD
jgi:hypothetical protein